MEFVKGLSFSKHNFIFAFICFAGILLLFMASIRPIYSQGQTLTEEIPQLKARIAEQQQLQTVIDAMDRELKDPPRAAEFTEVLMEPVSQDRISLIIPEIRQLAAKSGIKVTRMEPLLRDKDKEWHNLTIKAEMQGRFLELQSFLHRILALPYVKHIDQLEIHSADGILNLSLTYTVIMA